MVGAGGGGFAALPDSDGSECSGEGKDPEEDGEDHAEKLEL